MASRSRHGLSLIEVVAAIALLSSLMTVLLMAWTRHRDQIQFSQLKIQAAELLDEQLASWFADGGGPPFPATGRLADSVFIWRTYRSPTGRAIAGGLMPVTVEVVDQNNRSLLSIEVAGTVRPRQRREDSQ